MLCRAAWKVSARLPRAPGLTQYGRNRGYASRLQFLINRHMSTLTRSDDNTTHAQEQSTQWAPRPARPAVTSSTKHATTSRDRNSRPVRKPDSSITHREPGSAFYAKKQQKLRHTNGQEYSHMQVLTKVLERKTNCEAWERVAAETRVVSLPIVLAQMLLQQRAVAGTPEGDEMLALLPSETEVQKRIRYFDKKNQQEKDVLKSYAHILSGIDDDQRCQRLLDYGRQVPAQVLLVILRPGSALRDIPTLRRLVESYKPNEAVSLKESRRNSYLWPPNYLRILSLIGRHIARTEPRLLIELADTASAYVKKFVEAGDSHKRHVDCCRLFNEVLQIFQPESHLLDKQIAVVNAYFWECQRMLLTLSESFQRPLLVTGNGFRAIRNTLAGMPKNESERHSALLHAPSWPPYLTPGDGMDEITDPETNWSRTVEAGMLMQEAGFAKSEADDSLDILKGMAPDGTPTIQQRTMANNNRTVSAWEASIRATRDAHEAWARFNEPPTKGAVPGIDEYAAMFQKLMQREAAPASKLLPGDKAQNFPAYRAANLADIEWAKSRPPSVEELYSHMRDAGIIPSGHCLSILVANAPDQETAHRYLETAADLDPNISSLFAPRVEPEALRQVGNGLFAAYIDMLARRDGRSGWENLQRAITLAEARLGDKRSRWASLVWGSILKGASRHHSALRMSQSDQVELIMAIAKRIERGHKLNLAHFAELNKSLRKLIRYDLNALADELQQSDATSMSASKIPLRALYDTVLHNKDGTTAAEQLVQEADLVPGSLKAFVEYIKREFANFQAREASYQAASRDSYISPLDRMLSRNDAVRSEHALEYMLALGYAGEFEEMKKVLHFLIREWGQPDLVQDLAALSELPPSADFSELLCVFRLLGEQMLGGPAVAEEMQDAIVACGLPWTWPDGTAVQAYLHMQPNDSIRQVQSILTQMRAQKEKASAQAKAASVDSGNTMDENSQALGSNKGGDVLGQSREMQWQEKFRGRLGGGNTSGSQGRRLWPFQAKQ